MQNKFEKLYRVGKKLYPTIKELAEYFNKPYRTVQAALNRASATKLGKYEIYGTSVTILTREQLVQSWVETSESNQNTSNQNTTNQN